MFSFTENIIACVAFVVFFFCLIHSVNPIHPLGVFSPFKLIVITDIVGFYFLSRILILPFLFFFHKFIYLFIFGCVGSSLLRTGFL